MAGQRSEAARKGRGCAAMGARWRHGAAGCLSERRLGGHVVLDIECLDRVYLNDSFIGISALSVILKFRGCTSVQHLVMLQ